MRVFSNRATEPPAKAPTKKEEIPHFYFYFPSFTYYFLSVAIAVLFG